jgi:hypothetical protein
MTRIQLEIFSFQLPGHKTDPLLVSPFSLKSMSFQGNPPTAGQVDFDALFTLTYKVSLFEER